MSIEYTGRSNVLTVDRPAMLRDTIGKRGLRILSEEDNVWTLATQDNKQFTINTDNIFKKGPSTFEKMFESGRQGIVRVEQDQSVGDAYLEGINPIPLVEKRREVFDAMEPVKGETFVSDTIYKTIGIAAPMLQSYKEMGKLPFYSALGGAIVGIVAGNFIPGALAVPEEIITAPTGAAVGGKLGLFAGAKVGVTYKLAEYWYRQGLGQMLSEMVENGVDPKIAGPVAAVAAVPYAAIEFSQISKLTPGLRKGVQQAGLKSMLGVIRKAGIKYGETWTTEVLEEVLQEGVQIAANDIGKYLDGQDVELDKKGFLKRGKRLVNTMIESGQAMLLLPLGGAAMDVTTGTITVKNKNRFERELVKKLGVSREVAKKASEKMKDDAWSSGDVENMLTIDKTMGKDVALEYEPEAEHAVPAMREDKIHKAQQIMKQPKAVDARLAADKTITGVAKAIAKPSEAKPAVSGATTERATLQSIFRNEKGQFVSVFGKKLTKQEKSTLAETVSSKVKLIKDDMELTDEYYDNKAKALFPDASRADLRKVAGKLKKQTNSLYSKYVFRRQAIAMQATQEILDSKGFVKPDTRPKYRSFIHEQHDKTESLLLEMADMKDGSFSKSVIYDAVNEGVDKQYKFFFELKDWFVDSLEKLDYGANELESMSDALAPRYARSDVGKLIPKVKHVERTKVELSKGTAELTRGQILDIAMHALHPKSLKAMTSKRGWHEGKVKHKPMTIGDVGKIVDTLSNKERQLLSIAVQLGKIMGDKDNEVSMEMDGEKKFGVYPYWHMTRTELTPHPIGKRVSHIYQVLENRSPFHARRHRADNPVVISDFFSKLYNSMVDHAAYYGLAQPIRDAKLLISDRDWSMAVRDKYGQTVLDVLVDYIGRVEDASYYRIPMGKWWSDRLNKVVRAILGVNPSVSLKQFVSYILSADELGYGRMAKGLFHVPGKRERAIIKEFIPQLEMRYKHGRVTREMGDLGRMGAARRAFLGRLTLDDIAMATIREMDFQAIGKIIHSVEQELAETQPDLEAGTEKWGAAMNKRVMEIVRRTQPTWEPKDRSYIGGTRSQILRWFTVFHSQRETTVGMLNRANQQFRIDGNIYRLSRTYGLVATTNVMYSAIGTLVGAYVYRRDTDLEDFLIDMGTGFARLPYFGEILAMAMRYAMKGVLGKAPPRDEPFEAITGEAFSHIDRGLYNMTAAIRHSITGEEYKSGKHRGELKWKVEAKRAGEELGLAIALYHGAPLYAPYKIAKGFVKTMREISGEEDAERRRRYIDIYK